MAKKFMFVCVGILALTIAFLLGAQFGQAEYVDPAATGIVAVTQYGSGLVSNSFLLDNGEIWRWWDGWVRTNIAPLPVPLSDIKFFGNTWIVTQANEVWVGSSTGWTNVGSPGSGTATQPSTWGSIKAQFK
jgi:hypothetical protein